MNIRFIRLTLAVKPFKGNPAAVVMLEELNLDKSVASINMETAFLRPGS